MSIVTTPAPPSNPAASQSTAQAAQAAALKMLETSVIDDSTAPIEVGDAGAKEASLIPAEPEDEGTKEEPLIPADSDEPKEEEKPAVEGKKEEKKGLPDPLKNSFEKLAREKSEMRAREAGLKEREAKTSKYEMLERAVANNDALGALAMLGLKHSTLVKQVIDKGEAVDDEGEAPVQTQSNVYEDRIAKLERTIAQQNNERTSQDIQGRINKFASVNAEQFPNVAGDPDLATSVVEHMLNFVKQTGHPPGETIEESIQMAVEAVEAREEAALKKALKRRGLTLPVKAADNTQAGTKSAVAPAASELAKKSKTLTNSHASTPRAVGSTTAETPEELRAKALAILEAQSD